MYAGNTHSPSSVDNCGCQTRRPLMSDPIFRNAKLEDFATTPPETRRREQRTIKRHRAVFSNATDASPLAQRTSNDHCDAARLPVLEQNCSQNNTKIESVLRISHQLWTVLIPAAGAYGISSDPRRRYRMHSDKDLAGLAVLGEALFPLARLASQRMIECYGPDMAFVEAAHNGCVRVMRWIVDYGGLYEGNAEAAAREGLCAACSKGHVAASDWILRKFYGYSYDKCNTTLLKNVIPSGERGFVDLPALDMFVACSASNVTGMLRAVVPLVEMRERVDLPIFNTETFRDTLRMCARMERKIPEALFSRALTIACAHGSLASVEYLLSRHEINQICASDFGEAIFSAMCVDNPTMLEILAKNRTLKKYMDDKVDEIFGHAISHGSAKIAMRLSDEYGLNHDDVGASVITSCACSGSRGILDWMLYVFLKMGAVEHTNETSGYSHSRSVRQEKISAFILAWALHAKGDQLVKRLCNLLFPVQRDAPGASHVRFDHPITEHTIACAETLSYGCCIAGYTQTLTSATWPLTIPELYKANLNHDRDMLSACCAGGHLDTLKVIIDTFFYFSEYKHDFKPEYVRALRATSALGRIGVAAWLTQKMSLDASHFMCTQWDDYRVLVTSTPNAVFTDIERYLDDDKKLVLSTVTHGFTEDTPVSLPYASDMPDIVVLSCGRENPVAIACGASILSRTPVFTSKPRPRILWHPYVSSAFTCCCAYGRLEMAEWMLNIFGEQVAGSSMMRGNAFAHACANGHLDVAKWMYETLRITDEEARWMYCFGCVMALNNLRTDLPLWLKNTFGISEQELLDSREHFDETLSRVLEVV